MLEFSLIKEHRPRFNVRLVDDKSYPYLAVTVSDEWPRPMVMRGAKRKGVRYFGPYAHAYAIRETLDLLLRTFPLRTCTDAKFGRHHRMGRPCLLFHIEKCSGALRRRGRRRRLRRLRRGPARVPRGRHRRRRRPPRAPDAGGRRRAGVRAGRPGAGPAGLGAQGHREAADRRRPLRGHRRDRPGRGRPRGRRPGVLRAQGPGGRAAGLRGRQGRGARPAPAGRQHPRGPLLRRAGGRLPQGRAVLRPARRPRPVRDVADRAAGQRRVDGRQRAGRVQIRVPQRGDKRELLATVTRNAEEEFVRHRLRRASDINARSKALEELQDTLGLPIAPLRIECYDNSHLGGTDYVSSMVVFEDGLPAKGQYRRFRLRNVPGNDDFAAMEEVLTRRLTQLPGGPRPAAGRAGPLPVPAPAADGRRRQGPARAWPSGCWRSWAWPRRSRSARWPRSSRRSTCPARATRSACPAGPRRSTCCSGCGTSRTASPSPTSASSATSG